MAFNYEFCCKSGGSNLNAGTRDGVTEPSASAALTYASGSWVASTRVFTVASGNPVTDGLNVGDWVSVYADGSTTTGYVAQVTARTTTTITLSSSIMAGTAPTDGTSNRTLKLGGAWAGPSGTTIFPYGFNIGATLSLARVNFKNDQTYNVTASLADSSSGGRTMQGFTSSFGDGGKSTFDGGTSGASYNLLNLSGSIGTNLLDLCYQNNGATGSADLAVYAGSRSVITRCVFSGGRGNGLYLSGGQGFNMSGCEAFDNNKSNTASKAGFYFQNVGDAFGCISHDNSGSNTAGFYFTGGGGMHHCIADTNGGIGFRIESFSQILTNCDAYNNGSHGISGGGLVTTASNLLYNCNLIKNGGWGLLGHASYFRGYAKGLRFGAGTQANTSGTYSTLGPLIIDDFSSYANDVTPWVDPANGDFRIALAAAKGAGSIPFLQTAPSYSGTVAYQDIGAAQHLGSASGGARLVGHSPLVSA